MCSPPLFLSGLGLVATRMTPLASQGRKVGYPPSRTSKGQVISALPAAHTKLLVPWALCTRHFQACTVS